MIYDILPSMLIKKKKVKVVKNNAIAQTKIISPIGGIVKSSKIGQSVNNYIVSPPSIFIQNKLFKTANNQLFLLGIDGEIFKLNLTESTISAAVLSKKYLLLNSSICSYSRTDILENGQIKNLSSVLFCPLSGNSKALKSKNINIESFLVDNTKENSQLEKFYIR